MEAVIRCWVHPESEPIEAAIRKLCSFPNVISVKWKLTRPAASRELRVWEYTGLLTRKGKDHLTLDSVVAELLTGDVLLQDTLSVDDHAIPPHLSHSCYFELPPGLAPAVASAPMGVSTYTHTNSGEGLLKTLQSYRGFRFLERSVLLSYVEPKTLIPILEWTRENSYRGLTSLSIPCGNPTPAFVSFSRPLFVAIARCCPNLVQLDLASSYSGGRHPECDLVDITNILSSLKKLEVLQLDMEYATPIREEHFDALKVQPFEYILDPVFPRMRSFSIKCDGISKCMAPLIGWVVGTVPKTCEVSVFFGKFTKTETSQKALDDRLARKREATYAAAHAHFASHSWRKLK